MQTTKPLTVVFLALVSIALIGCKKTESDEPVAMMALGLRLVQENWVKEGRPDNFKPDNVVQSSVEHFSVFTNEIAVAAVVYHCRFAVRSDLIHTPGIMAITDEGVLLWIRDRDG